MAAARSHSALLLEYCNFFLFSHYSVFSLLSSLPLPSASASASAWEKPSLVAMGKVMAALLVLGSFHIALVTVIAQAPPTSAPSPAYPPSPASASSPAPAPGPPYTNVTDVIDVPREYTQFLKLMAETGAGEIFQTRANNTDVGITIFAPTDTAFSKLPPGALANLTAESKLALALYHGLTKFVDLAGLQQIKEPFTATLASQRFGGYTLNVTYTKSDVVLVSSGNIRTIIATTMVNSVPAAIFGITEVLKPLELFGYAPPAPSPAPTASDVPPGSSPDISLSPPGSNSTSSNSSSAGDLSGNGSSASTLQTHSSLFLFLSFLSFFYLHVL